LDLVAITPDDRRAEGQLNAWGNSIPTEDLAAKNLKVGGVLFRLATVESGADSFETLGQQILLPSPSSATGLALLAYGEMGAQRTRITVFPRNGDPIEWIAEIPGGMVEPDQDLGHCGWVASHLHYPGGYDLQHLLPSLWMVSHRWRRPIDIATIRFGRNPMFRVLALTLLNAEDGDE
jgi:hypothetical protein